MNQDTKAPLRTILFMGLTGSGKGTQTKMLAQKTGFEVFSTGSRFMELRERQDDLGARIRVVFDNGLLMPSWFATLLFQEKLVFAPDDQGFIFEGACRTLEETRNFHDATTWLGRSYIAFLLNIPEEEAMHRQLARGRLDSYSEEKIRTRFNEYRTLTIPGIEFLRSNGTVIEIDGMRSVDEIHADVMHHLQDKL